MSWRSSRSSTGSSRGFRQPPRFVSQAGAEYYSILTPRDLVLRRIAAMSGSQTVNGPRCEARIRD